MMHDTRCPQCDLPIGGTINSEQVKIVKRKPTGKHVCNHCNASVELFEHTDDLGVCHSYRLVVQPTPEQLKQYQRAFNRAVGMMEACEVEPTSAFKQGGSDEGIPYGDEMEKFVTWANKKAGI